MSSELKSMFSIGRIARHVLGVSLVVLFALQASGAEYVVHISVDGLHPGDLQSVIDAGQAPTFKRLQAEGAWTANARTDFDYTVTIPNHTTMLTGRPVVSPKGMPKGVSHGFTANRRPSMTTTLHNIRRPASNYIASVFDVVHDAGLTTAFYVSKSKFEIYEQSYNASTGAPHARGRDKIDRYFYQNDGPPRYAAGMNRRFLADMAARRFNYAFVHYRDPDSTGHAFGWGSGAYRQAIMIVDSYLAAVLQLVETDPMLAGRTTVIVTTDHGGIGTNHGDSYLADNYTIPLFVWGASVGRGDLYAMNVMTRAINADTRPDYLARQQPIRNGDTGNLALQLLGLGPIPGSLINARQDLHVARHGDFNGDGRVDAADYNIWRDTLGSTTDRRADANGDGTVDHADYALWKAISDTVPAAKP